MEAALGGADLDLEHGPPRRCLHRRDARLGGGLGSVDNDSEAAAILVTTNGGATWSKQSSGGFESVQAVDFVSATHGWAVGNGGAILATTNGGASWSYSDPWKARTSPGSSSPTLSMPPHWASTLTHARASTSPPPAEAIAQMALMLRSEPGTVTWPRAESAREPHRCGGRRRG